MLTEDIVPWAWLIIAMVFFLAEVMTAGFVLAAFGVGALAAALTAFLGLGLQWQLIVFVLVSSASVLFSRRFADRVSGAQAQNVGIDRVLGKRAVVLEAIDPITASGRVRVEREEWRAQAADDRPIPAQAVVEIVGVEGTRLLVRQITPPIEPP